MPTVNGSPSTPLTPALYKHRHAIAGIVVTEASLEEAFLALVAQPPKQGDRAGMPLLSSPTG
jgi:hypothetical protein